MAKKRIGAMLEERGLITEFQLVAALSHQRKWKGKLGRSLIELGYLDEQKLYEVLAEQVGMTLVDLRSRQIPLEVLAKISRKEAQALKAVPVEIKGTTVVVAVAEPDKPDLQAALAKAAGQPVELVLGLESAIEVLNSTMSDKVPVTTIQPVKKAFIRNHRGEMEPLEVFPGAEPKPARAHPPASEDAPIALDDGESDALPPASAPSLKLPEPEPPGAQARPASSGMPSPAQPPSDSSAPEPTRPLNIPDLELPPPPAPPAAVSTLIPAPPVAPAAAPDLPEDLWAMPKSDPSSESEPAPESSLPLIPAAGGMDLPPPPSLDLSDLPPPPSQFGSPALGGEEKAMPSVPELDLAPPEEIPLPEADEKRPPLTQVPSLELPLEETKPAPQLEVKPEPLPEPPEMREGAQEKSFDQLIPSLLEDLSSLTASPKKRKEEEPGEVPPLKVERIEAKPPAPPAEPPKPLEPETPPWLEQPHASSPPVAPLEGLVTEDIKADAVAFQQEIRRAERMAGPEKTEPELEVAPHDALDRRLVKLEEEVRKLRETVESLVLKIRP